MLKQVRIIIMALFFVSCFGAVFFEFHGRAFIYMCAYCFFVFFFYRYSQEGLFRNIIIFFFFSALLSVLSCNYFRGQGLYITFLEYNIFFALAFYFYLHREQPKILEMEQILYLLCMAFIVAYIVQYIVWPMHLFKGSFDDIHATENNLRIRMVSSGFASLGYYMGLNKFLCKSHNLVDIMLVLLGFISILMMGFRTLLAGLTIMSAIMVIRVYGFSYKIVIVAIVAIPILFILVETPLGQHVLEEMTKRQEMETFSNTDYIRWIQLDYFENNHFTNNIERFFGSGIPSMAYPSSYSKYFFRINQYAINFQDWGLWGCSWVMGIPSFIFMMWYGIKAGITKVSSPQYYYLGIWFIFMIIVSFTSYEFCRSGNFIVQAMVLYLIDKVYVGEKSRNINISSRGKLRRSHASVGFA